jgi:hypothetical protein
VDKRELAVTYHWKGYLGKLATEKKDVFEARMSSCDPIPNIEYQFWMEPGSAKALRCSNIGMLLDDEKLEELRDVTKGMKCWKYEAIGCSSNLH